MIARIPHLFAALLLAFLASSSGLRAADAVNMLAGDRLAIHGADPVAYFVDGGPRAGRADLTVEHAGAVWRFASEANRRRFRENPARYVPAFGGYCAFGVSRGYLVKVDPEAWTIIDDRLYLNYDPSIRDEWLQEPKSYIARARRNWPQLVDAQAADIRVGAAGE